jgi:DNA-binding protein HU-beta
VLSIAPLTRTGESQLAKAKTQAATKAVKKLTKGALIAAILEDMGEGWARKDVVKVLDSLTQIGHNELKKKGMFILPGFAKFVVIKKPARPAREGINPFTKEPTTFAAKPASKAVKARPAKAIKDAIA